MRIQFVSGRLKALFLGGCASTVALALLLPGCSQPPSGGEASSVVTVVVPPHPAAVDSLIYSEMLEDCNDSIIYGGVVNADGSPRPAVDAMIRPLDIPVVRWPGGTYSLEYHWEKAVGPLAARPVTPDSAWGGTDNNRFGTDEFLAWCAKVGTRAYINFNMGNHPPQAGTLPEALHWIEYVNGAIGTPYGKKRAANGHPEPYGVRYWGVGNENYGSWGSHSAESDSAYADRLLQWATAMQRQDSSLLLLGVGHTYRWDSTVLAKCGGVVALLTQHYYVTSRIRDHKVEDPERSLFAPVKMEAHLQMLKPLVEAANQRFDRQENPLRLSVDEWDNRHNVYDSGKYSFTRQDPRYQFDAAVVAGMLNVFIRQSPLVGMANYIFPVNGHGLIRSVGDTGAYRTSIYYVFDQYRKWMTGRALSAGVTGPGVKASDIRMYMDGDAREAKLDSAHLSYVDASAVENIDGSLTVALVNRDAAHPQKVTVAVPDGYVATKAWVLEHDDINAYNAAGDRDRISPRLEDIAAYSGRLSRELSPCGLQLIRFQQR
jgi:alpha-N-arabinofuranosidase